MYIVWGSRLYGKVDVVPGAFHVATKFGHLWYIPLIPTTSYVIFTEDKKSGQFRGIPIGLNGKSILVSYAIAICIALCVAGAVGIPITMTDRQSQGMWFIPVILLAAGIAGLVALYTAKGIRKASHARALAIAQKAGISAAGQEAINQIFNRPHGAGGAFPVVAAPAPRQAAVAAVPAQLADDEGPIPLEPEIVVDENDQPIELEEPRPTIGLDTTSR